MARHNDTGKWGEDLAVAYLHDQGYTIRERDWRAGHRDIDIVAVTPDNMTVVFVEVKTRTSDVVLSPEDAVDIRKIRHLAYAANQYVKMHDVREELRFDIISIVGENKDVAQLEHIVDAFNPLLAFR